jgi:hypothetical protein
MSNLTISELLKYKWRADRFIEKYKNEEKFVLVGGQKVGLVFSEATYALLQGRRYIDYNKIEFVDKNVKTRKYKFHSFRKTEEFGGVERLPSLGIDNSKREVNSINNQFNIIRSKSGEKAVPIRFRNKTYMVYTAVLSDNSTIDLCDENNEPLLYISYRDGDTPRKFGMWCDDLSNQEINKFTEVRSFITAVQSKFQNGMTPQDRSVACRIREDALEKVSVYGPDYGGKISKNNISYIAQGRIQINPDGSGFVVSSNRIYENGDSVVGGYTPILIAQYQDKASDFGVPNCRMSIQPLLVDTNVEWLKSSN